MVEKTEASFNLIQSIRGGSKYGIRNATHAGEGGLEGREGGRERNPSVLEREVDTDLNV